MASGPATGGWKVGHGLSFREYPKTVGLGDATAITWSHPRLRGMQRICAKRLHPNERVPTVMDGTRREEDHE